MRLSIFLCFVICLLPAAAAERTAPAPAAAATSSADTAGAVSNRTVRQILIENAGLGTDLQDRIEAVGKMVSDNETARAMREVDLLLAEFKKLMPDNGSVYISVSSDAQFVDFAKSNRSKNLVRVSWGFQKLLFLKAFILAEEKPQQAQAVLTELIKYAPSSSDAYCELGYLQSLLKQPKQALESYQAALALCEKFASEKHSRAVALRGLGYANAALGDYGKAAEFYRRSLEIDDNNQIALEGLKFIQQAAAKKAQPNK